MIPMIGIMIGAYIIVRMADILAGKQPNAVVFFLAILTIALTLFCSFGLILLGIDIPDFE